MTSHNYMSVNPTYQLVAHYPESAGGTAIAGRSGSTLHTGLTAKEVKVFSEYYLRTGANFTVSKEERWGSFGQVISDMRHPIEVIDDDELTCFDCGRDIYGPGAPAICAAAHKCAACDELNRDCKCPTTRA